jgi:hypothetical protein
VLVMPDCDVLTESVVQAIRRFQDSGGIVVGDQRTCPAIQPDLTIPVYQRTGKAREDKQALLERAAALQQALVSRFRAAVESDHPEVIPYRRRWNRADYVFLVNDRRDFGRYVGHHGLVMEQGRPSRATVRLARTKGNIYDLVQHQPVPANVIEDRLAADIRLGPCDGTVWLVTDQAIENVACRHRETVERGKSLPLTVEVQDGAGRPVEAVVPVEVTILDPEGREGEFSGWYAAEAGRLSIQLDIAANDPFGVWEIRVRELAAGCRATSAFEVPGPDPWPPVRADSGDRPTDPEQPAG